MVKIAIVEDEKECADNLEGFLLRYDKEHGEGFSIDVFLNSVNFIENYKASYDIVFLDIEMPLMDGMTVAHKLRERDGNVVIVFITYMAKYAIEGYAVNAVDYILKPLTYFNFSDKLGRALRHVVKQDAKIIKISDEGESVFVSVSKIFYIEKDKNYLVFHTDSGVYRHIGTLNELESEIRPFGFSRCISGALVNLGYVTKTSVNSVWVNGDCLPISRTYKKIFISDLMTYISTGGM